MEAGSINEPWERTLAIRRVKSPSIVTMPRESPREDQRQQQPFTQKKDSPGTVRLGKISWESPMLTTNTIIVATPSAGGGLS